MGIVHRKLSTALIVVLSLIYFTEYSRASTLLPWVRFIGTYQVTAGIGAGSLTLNAFVNEMDYENGDVWKANVPGVETIYGARAALSGATRTGDYSFNGNPADPDDVTFSIIASDGYVYLTSTLADIVFTQQGTNFAWLNRYLNANDPETLNLRNVVLRPNGDDGLHPSRYLNELAAYLGSANVSGLKMQLFAPSPGNFTTNSSGTITFGLLDGLKSNLIPPTVTTEPATIENGAAVTLNATVNPNGSETIVYFEWGTTTSYGNITPSGSIGNGVTADSISDYLTDLLPGTTYHYKAVAVNEGGTSFGDDMSFTTPPIILAVVSPQDGDTVNRPDVMVRGTIANITGNETGIIVNGKAAAVYDNQFIVNHVSFQTGQNTITAAAVDTAGNTVTMTATVDAVTTTPHIILNANIASGTAPLTTYFSASASIPDSAVSYAVDYEGDGTVDYTGAAFENVSHTFATEGIYYPVITVTDNKNNTYTDTIAIVVLNRTYIDTLLRGKWTAMKTALANKDVEGAIGYFVDRAKERYRIIFEALRDQLPVIAGTFTEFNIVAVHDNVAEYEVVANEDGVLHSYPGVVIKDGNGIWKFKDF